MYKILTHYDLLLKVLMQPCAGRFRLKIQLFKLPLYENRVTFLLLIILRKGAKHLMNDYNQYIINNLFLAYVFFFQNKIIKNILTDNRYTYKLLL